MLLATRRILMIAAVAVTGAAKANSSLDQLVDVAASRGFAGEVVVTDLSKNTYARAVSATDRAHERGELWRWASVTKQLTATLVMQLVAEGKLSLDDTLAKRMPAFKGASAARTTVRMLLQHTTELPNPDDAQTHGDNPFPDFYQRSTPDVGGIKDALGYCAGQIKPREPNTFSYNNCDYIVLGALVEKISGGSYADQLEQRIAKPAGLSSTRLIVGGDPAPKTIKGMLEDGKPEFPFVLANFGPAGAVVGSADDLARFDRALLNHVLLPKAETAISWEGNPKLGYIALGVWGFSAPLKNCDGPVRLVERRGGIGGIEVRNLLAPDRGMALVVFTDRAGWDFGEIWQGKGFTYDLASAAFCP